MKVISLLLFLNILVSLFFFYSSAKENKKIRADLELLKEAVTETEHTVGEKKVSDSVYYNTNISKCSLSEDDFGRLADACVIAQQAEKISSDNRIAENEEQDREDRASASPEESYNKVTAMIQNGLQNQKVTKEDLDVLAANINNVEEEKRGELVKTLIDNINSGRIAVESGSFIY